MIKVRVLVVVASKEAQLEGAKEGMVMEMMRILVCERKVVRAKVKMAGHPRR